MQAASEVGGKKVNLLDPITLAVALIQTEVSDAPIPVRVMEVLAGRQSFSSFSLIFIPYKKKFMLAKQFLSFAMGTFQIFPLYKNIMCSGSKCPGILNADLGTIKH